MDREEQLVWERRVGRYAAYCAFGAALLLLAAFIYSATALNGTTHDSVDSAKLVHSHQSAVIVITILQSLSVVLLAPVLWFLYEVTKFRRPETPSLAKWLALIAPPVAGVAGIVRVFLYLDAVDKALKKLGSGLPPQKAIDLVDNQLKTGGLTAVGAVSTAAALGLAFAFVVISLNAQRSGVLSKFMGVLGIIVGVLFVLPLFGQFPVVELFWVAALGVLFLDLWPQGGRGPAWDAGEALPWPTAADRQDAIRRARGEQVPVRPQRQPIFAGRRPVEEPEPDLEDDVIDQDGEPEHEDAAHARSHPRSKKRKRKRR